MPSFSNKLSLSLLLGIFISKGDGLNCARSLAFFFAFIFAVRCALHFLLRLLLLLLWRLDRPSPRGKDWGEPHPADVGASVPNCVGCVSRERAAAQLRQQKIKAKTEEFCLNKSAEMNF